MSIQPDHKQANTPSASGRSAASNDGVIYMSQRRVEELDPVDISVPDEEIRDPKKIDPIGNYGNNESPSNVDGADSMPGSDEVDDLGAGDDEDTPHPITPEKR
jgi:hypothetical protein